MIAEKGIEMVEDGSLPVTGIRFFVRQDLGLVSAAGVFKKQTPGWLVAKVSALFQALLDLGDPGRGL